MTLDTQATGRTETLNAEVQEQEEVQGAAQRLTEMKQEPLMSLL